MPQNRVSIFDTTLRDGEQSPGCSMNLREKVRMAMKLQDGSIRIWMPRMRPTFHAFEPNTLLPPARTVPGRRPGKQPDRGSVRHERAQSSGFVGGVGVAVVVEVHVDVTSLGGGRFPVG